MNENANEINSDDTEMEKKELKSKKGSKICQKINC